MEVELAKSGRSKCLICDRRIHFGFPRISSQGIFICHKCADKYLSDLNKEFLKIKEEWEEIIKLWAKEIVMDNLKDEN